MAQTPQFDSYELNTLAVPYWKARRPLDEDPPSIVAGINVIPTLGGRLLKRFGTADMVVGDPQNLPATTGRIDRLFFLESESPWPGYSWVRFIVASVYDSASNGWRLKYLNVTPSATAYAWKTIASGVNGIELSTRPHEAVASRGRLYVRGVPSQSPGSNHKYCGAILSPDPDREGELMVDYWGIPDPQTPARILGAITRITASVDATTTTFVVENAQSFPSPPFVAIIGFEEVYVTAVGGSGNTTWTVTRGYNDTEPSRHAAYTPILWRDFSASDSDIQTVVGWQYAYSYKSRTGHVSSRSPVADKVNELPSATGPFRALCPRIRIPGHPDTTRIPKIVIYRTTDGGGVFYRIAEIDNTGGAFITFTDNAGAEGVQMPVPDTDISGGPVAPTLTSNSPPPPVAHPRVMGEDDPEPSTPIARYANRIWYALGNTLFYSALEENATGNPEESFPSGTTGNYFRTLERIISLVASPECLFVFTASNVYQVTGSTRETFVLRLFASNVGMHPDHPHAVAAYRDSVFFLNSNFHISAISGDRVRTVSYPVYADLECASPSDYNVELHPLVLRDHEMLMVLLGHRLGWGESGQNSPPVSYSSQLLYDFNLSLAQRIDFWTPPWDIPARCGVRAKTRILEQEFLVLATYDSTTGESILVTPSPHSGYDLLPSGDLRPVRAWFYLSPIRCPAGNHLNALRVPMQYPILSHITLVWRVMSATSLPGWSAYATYSEPRLFYALDELPNVTEPVPFGSYGKTGGWQPGWNYSWGSDPPFSYSPYPMQRPYHITLPSTYVEAIHWIDRTARRVIVGVELPESGSRMEIDAIVVSWLPTYGI